MKKGTEFRGEEGGEGRRSCVEKVFLFVLVGWLRFGGENFHFLRLLLPSNPTKPRKQA